MNALIQPVGPWSLQKGRSQCAYFLLSIACPRNPAHLAGYCRPCSGRRACQRPGLRQRPWVRSQALPSLHLQRPRIARRTERNTRGRALAHPSLLRLQNGSSCMTHPLPAPSSLPKVRGTHLLRALLQHASMCDEVLPVPHLSCL